MRIKGSHSGSVFCLALLISVFGFSSESKLLAGPKANIAPHRKDRIIVKRANGRLAASSFRNVVLKLRVIAKFKSLGNLEVVEVPAGMSVDEALKRARQDSSVVMASPDYYLYATDLPNDADFSKQWGLNNTGQDGGTVDVDINAPEAWVSTLGTKQSVMGIIDTGVNYNHKDLMANMWTNPGEIPGNGIDDDNNGYIDDVHGINAITDSGDPMDDNGHGSHVAGIIGAAGNNGIGVSGVMQNTSMVACKFLDSRGSGTSADALKCLDYFAALATRDTNKVPIVATNNSWAGGGYSSVMEDAIKKHMDVGILFMAAASNDGQNNDVVETYPANYALPNIISVAAIDHKGALASFSNFGMFSVDVAAPGVDIFSTLLGEDGYKSLSGTSMATPFVTGLAGLIKSSNPSLDWKQIKNLILTSGVPSENLSNTTISGRRIRAADLNGLGALSCTGQMLQKRLEPRQNAITMPLGSVIPVSLMNIMCAENLGMPAATVNGEPLALHDDGKDGDQAVGDGLYTGMFKPTKVGDYTLAFFGTDIVTANIYDSSSWVSYRLSHDTTFNYREIDGIDLNAGDDTIHQVKSPFPIKFASMEGGFSVINVSSNGALSVTDDKHIGWDNYPLPYKYLTSIIAPYWDDLTAREPGAKLSYAVVGNAPNRELVIEWKNVKQYSVWDNDITFQVVFFENSSNILFNYLDVDLDDNSYGNGSEATVGVQIGSTKAMLVSCDKNSLKNNSSLLFVPNTPPVAIAGPDQIVANNMPITLDGSASYDPDGDALTYRWVMLGESSMTFAEQSSPILTVPSDGLSGDYVFTLTVSDPSGDSSTDETKVNVVVTPEGDGDEPLPPADSAPNMSFMLSPLLSDAAILANSVPRAPTPFNSEASNRGELVVKNAFDADGDLLIYNFYISESPSFNKLVSSVSGVQEGENGITSVPIGELGLSSGKSYYWYAEAVDVHGNKSPHSKTMILATKPVTAHSEGGCRGGTRGAKGNGAAFIVLTLFLLPKKRKK